MVKQWTWPIFLSCGLEVTIDRGKKYVWRLWTSEFWLIGKKKKSHIVDKCVVLVVWRSNWRFDFTLSLPSFPPLKLDWAYSLSWKAAITPAPSDPVRFVFTPAVYWGLIAVSMLVLSMSSVLMCHCRLILFRYNCNVSQAENDFVSIAKCRKKAYLTTSSCLLYRHPHIYSQLQNYCLHGQTWFYNLSNIHNDLNFPFKHCTRVNSLWNPSRCGKTKERSAQETDGCWPTRKSANGYKYKNSSFKKKL